MSEKEKICMELVFSKRPSLSRQVKVREFWKFFDSYNDVKPYTPSKEIVKISTEEISAISKECFSKNKPVKRKSTWYDRLKVFQKLGLDKTALAAERTCKICHVGNKDKNEDLADTVQQAYEDLSAEIEVFDKRIKDRKNAQDEKRQ